MLYECLIYLERLGFLDINYNQRTIKTTLEGQEYVRKFGYLMQQVGETSYMSTKNVQVWFHKVERADNVLINKIHSPGYFYKFWIKK